MSRATILGCGGMALVGLLGSAASAQILVEPIFDASGPGQHQNVMRLTLCDKPRTRACVAGEKSFFNVNSQRPDDLVAVNNTKFDLGKLVLQIRGDNAVWGDADMDGKVGKSNIFADDPLVSADKKTITFTGGSIARGSQFTDFKKVKDPGQQNMMIDVVGFFELAAPRKQEDGGGKMNFPMGSPPAPMEFSLDQFETFALAQEIELSEGVSLQPTLVNFESLIAFAPTADTNIFAARFTAFDFEYAPFDIPGTSFENIVRQVLDESVHDSEFGGGYDASTGHLFIDVPTKWLDDGGDVVAHSVQGFVFEITRHSSLQAEIILDGQSTFELVPEPSGAALVALATIGLTTVIFASRCRACDR
jgi:hypothetical protein